MGTDIVSLGHRPVLQISLLQESSLQDKKRKGQPHACRGHNVILWSGNQDFDGAYWQGKVLSPKVTGERQA